MKHEHCNYSFLVFPLAACTTAQVVTRWRQKWKHVKQTMPNLGAASRVWATRVCQLSVRQPSSTRQIHPGLQGNAPAIYSVGALSAWLELSPQPTLISDPEKSSAKIKQHIWNFKSCFHCDGLQNCRDFTKKPPKCWCIWKVCVQTLCPCASIFSSPFPLRRVSSKQTITLTKEQVHKAYTHSNLLIL